MRLHKTSPIVSISWKLDVEDNINFPKIFHLKTLREESFDLANDIECGPKD